MPKLLVLFLLAGCATFKPRVTPVSIGAARTLYEAQQEEINRLCREKGGFDYDVAGCWVPRERTIYCSVDAVGCLEHEACHAKGLPSEECSGLTYIRWRDFTWRYQ